MFVLQKGKQVIFKALWPMQRLGFFTRLGVDGNRHDILGYISRECEMQQEFYSCS
jgi:hypothetical protein